LNISPDSTDRTPQGSVVVLAATNRLQDLDEAVLRRFEGKVYVAPPCAATRLAMLQRHMRSILAPTPVTVRQWHIDEQASRHETATGDAACAMSEEEFTQVVELTAGWTGSDIEVRRIV
jgi:SpoVK/Ycf46/Vps4 family AAA+-type ATPase